MKGTMNRPKKTYGFTLVELMICIAIVGIIAAFGIPAYRSYIVDARMASAMNYASRLKTEAEVYYQLHRKFPHSGGYEKKEIIDGDVVYAVEHFAPRPKEATWIHVYIQPDTFPGAVRGQHALIFEGKADSNRQVTWQCQQHPGIRKIPDEYNPTSCSGDARTGGY